MYRSEEDRRMKLTAFRRRCWVRRRNRQGRWVDRRLLQAMRSANRTMRKALEESRQVLWEATDEARHYREETKKMAGVAEQWKDLYCDVADAIRAFVDEHSALLPPSMNEVARWMPKMERIRRSAAESYFAKGGRKVPAQATVHAEMMHWIRFAVIEDPTGGLRNAVHYYLTGPKESLVYAYSGDAWEILSERRAVDIVTVGLARAWRDRKEARL